MKKVSVCMYLYFSLSMVTTYAKAAPNTHDEYLYASLKPLLAQYQRPFTFLHLWPQKSTVAYNVASHNNCVTIIVDPHASRMLAMSSEYNNIVLLNSDLSIKDLRYFGECEHIDVTLISDITEVFPSDWKKAVDHAVTLGDHIIFQAPPANAKTYPSFIAYMKKKKAERIAVPSGVTARNANELYLCTVMKKYLIKRRWNYQNVWELGEYTIESSFTHKNFIKSKKRPKGYKVTQWHPGINLYTFKQLNGLYPSHETIRSMLYPLATLKHNDLRIFNLIIQGNTLVPIDENENERNANLQELLPGIIAQFRTMRLRLIQEFECPCAETYEELCS